jgi:uncharacterized protein (UPF0332 family)
MDTDCMAYLEKATESLIGAESEYANRRYNNCANRCYYAMFQAAVAALIAAGIRPADVKEQWGHDFVQAQFSGMLVRRRKLYSSDLVSMLPHVAQIRLLADYDAETISQTLAERALWKAKTLVSAVKGELL